MKTKICSICLLFSGIFATTQINAQLYLSYDAGWGLATVKSTIGTNYSSNGTSATFTGVYGSHGKGLNTNLMLGYSINDFLSVELGYGYHNMMGEVVTRSEVNTTSPSFSSTESYELSTSTSRLLIGLKLTAGDGSWKPYMKTIFLIGMGTKMDYYDHYSENDNGTSVTATVHYQFRNGSSFGGLFAFGLSKELNEKLSFFVQGTFIYSSWAPKYGEMKEYTVDGQDMIPSLTTSDKEIDFVDSYTVSGPPNTNEHSKEIKEYMPYSSAGLNIGITLHF